MEGQKVFVAINEVQKAVKNVTTDSTNLHYRSTYASLEATLDLLRPMWAKFGLSVVQDVDREGYLRTFVVHGESGDCFSFFYRMINSKGDLHGEGAAFTYSRRQAIKGIFGISEEDDDGNKAVNKKEPKQEPRPEMKNHAPKTPEGPARPGGGISESQWKRAIAIAIDKGWDKKTVGHDLAEVTRLVYGKEPAAMHQKDYNDLCASLNVGLSKQQIIDTKAVK